MPIDALHRTVAEIALRAAARHGFALAGGNALIVHGLIDRETQDVDLFTNLESGVKAASGAVEAALRAAGYRIRPVDKTAGLADIFPGMGDGLAEWLITAPGGREMTLQMSYFDRACEPVIMDIGPVLDLADLVGWKTVAAISRGSERDFIDLAAVLDRYSIAELIAIARRLDTGLMDEDIADAGRRLDALPDRVFARYGLSRRDVGRLRAKFAGWPALSPEPGQIKSLDFCGTASGVSGLARVNLTPFRAPQARLVSQLRGVGKRSISRQLR